jgi:small subunit ribosomal protein S15
MALTAEEKQEVFKDYGSHEGDTGSTAVQVAMLTKRINTLVEHLRNHKHDTHTQHGLMKLVGRRRRMLAYLRRTQPDAYKDLIQRLGLRR